MELLNLETEFLARNIIYLKEVDSTQKYIKSLSNLKNGTVVITDSQINGIGTHDRKWYTGNAENIAMTFLLNPMCNISKLNKLTVVIAEKMIEAIKNIYNIKLNIKEPNDIIYNGKKIGGILTESVSEGETVKKVYIGIGINLNQEYFPKEIENIATSLKKEFLGDYNREKIITEFFNIFEKAYLKMI